MAYELVNVYAIRIAGAFMISTYTLAIRVGMFRVGWRSSATLGAFATPEPRAFQLGSAGLSAVGVRD